MNFDDLKIQASSIGINLSENQIEQFKTYADVLIETNKIMNLTAITELGDVIEKHFLDSLLLFKLFDFKNSSLLDIGSGAGFPGVVLAIVEPTLNVTVLDATAKKIRFLQGLCEKLGLSNVNFINSRVEDLRKQRESFDYATARAFASLNTLIEVGIPLIKVHGKLVSMKSAKADEEIQESKNALHKLESKIISIDRTDLPYCKDTRVNIVIEKCQKSPKHFPRTWAEISAKPL